MNRGCLVSLSMTLKHSFWSGLGPFTGVETEGFRLLGAGR